VVGLLAAIVAHLMDLAIRQEFELDHLLLLCASGIVTASAASLILGNIKINIKNLMKLIFSYLGLITSLVIVLSKMCNVNPDNVATPIAGALGDITALVILSFTATLFYNILGMLLIILYFSCTYNYIFLISKCCVVVPCDLQHIRVSAAIFLLGSSPQQIHQGCAVPWLDTSYHRHGHPSVSFDSRSGFKWVKLVQLITPIC